MCKGTIFRREDFGGVTLLSVQRQSEEAEPDVRTYVVLFIVQGSCKWMLTTQWRL